MQEKADTELGLKDYVGILRRRGMLCFLVAAPIVTIALALAFRLPPVYESVGVLLVEQGEVPDYVVRSTVPDLPNERVRSITERVLTDDNLASIVDEHAPYPELSHSESLNRLRSDMISGAADPDMLPELVSRNESTIAFRVGFSHSDAEKARDIARDLVSLYLSENQRARQELAGQTLTFLSAQAERLEKRIAEKEAELAEFKRENAGRLPEMSDMNMQLLDRTERELENTEAEIRNLRERVSLIETELSQLSPYATVVDDEGNPMLSPTERLRMLQRRYAQSSAVYSQDHPDIRRLRREIDALSAQTGQTGIDASVLRATLAARQEELEAARDRGLSDEHPDVVRLERAVANLQEAIEEAPDEPAGNADAPPPDNPVYVQRQVELEAARVELDAALERREELRQRLADLEERLTAAPEVEREYASLSRGYDQLLAQYEEVQQKQQEAEIALNLESENRGERFSVLNSPSLPSLPAQPNRVAIVLLGLVLAFGAGGAAVAVAEVSDSTVRAPRDISTLLEIPPLVMIPYIDNETDVRERRWKRAALAAGVSAWLGVTALLVIAPTG